MVTRAKRASNNRWDKENMTILACKVRKDYADTVKQQASKRGTSVNAVLLNAVSDFMGESEYDEIEISFDPKEDNFTYDQIKAAADASGESVNAWIIEAIRDKL